MQAWHERPDGLDLPTTDKPQRSALRVPRMLRRLGVRSARWGSGDSPTSRGSYHVLGSESPGSPVAVITERAKECKD
jgi:hypothetical protein